MAKQSSKKLEEKRVGALGLKLNRQFSKSQLQIKLSTEYSQIVTQLRWWGESYGFFNRKSDAVIFSDELSWLFSKNIVIFGSKVIENSQTTPQPSKWYIDPCTATGS